MAHLACDGLRSQPTRTMPLIFVKNREDFEEVRSQRPYLGARWRAVVARSKGSTDSVVTCARLGSRSFSDKGGLVINAFSREARFTC